MAQQTYRANLGAASFPFLSRDFGQTTIISNLDQNFNPRVNSPSDLDADSGIPQVYFCENVMPIPEGFRSVGKENIMESFVTGVGSITKVFDIIDGDSVGGTPKVLYTKGSFPEGHAISTFLGEWQLIDISLTPELIDVPAYIITTANVRGVTYIFFSTIGCYVYNFSTNRLDPVTLSGLTMGVTRGIVSAFGYLIAYSGADTSIAWSSALDATDFVPSATTGAGSGFIEQLTGIPTASTTNDVGFYLFSATDCVLASYTGNAAQPFIFKKLQQVGGLPNQFHLPSTYRSQELYLTTSYGLQVITPQGGSQVFPEVSAFLRTNIIEFFNADENTIHFYEADKTSRTKYLMDRYVVFSYGNSESGDATFSYAIIYDTALKRYGKIRGTHSDITVNDQLGTTSPDIDRLVFVAPGGSFFKFSTDPDIDAYASILVFGKYKLTRDKLLHLHLLNYTAATTNFDLDVFTAGENPDGTEASTLPTAALYYPASTGSYKQNYTDAVDRVLSNHSIIFKGTAFKLTSLELTFSEAGEY